VLAIMRTSRSSRKPSEGQGPSSGWCLYDVAPNVRKQDLSSTLAR
jgi:hypothetical protein